MNNIVDSGRQSAFFLLVALSIATALPGVAAPICDPIAGCPPVVVATKYKGRPAYRLSDGHSVAVVVPALGRIMHYGLLNGPNLLWNSEGPWRPGEWRNWGGDKLWLAPQSLWPVTTGRAWPPDAAWDGSAFQGEVLTGGTVRLTGPLSRTGIRIVRDIAFNDTGELVIRQVVKKQRGGPLPLSLWSVTQVNLPDAVFVPRKASSAYRNGYYRFKTGKAEEAIFAASPDMWQLTPSHLGDFKLGFDVDRAAIIAVKGDTAFVQCAPRPKGEYPDGAVESGFAVELFNKGIAPAAHPVSRYMELELLSPLCVAMPGGKWTHTVRWSLQQLPPGGLAAPTVLGFLEAILHGRPSSAALKGPA